jgi:hypothetical protein
VLTAATSMMRILQVRWLLSDREDRLVGASIDSAC